MGMLEVLDRESAAERKYNGIKEYAEGRYVPERSVELEDLPRMESLALVRVDVDCTPGMRRSISIKPPASGSPDGTERRERGGEQEGLLPALVIESSGPNR